MAAEKLYYQCLRKKPYRTIEHAKNVAKKFKSEKELHAYYCSFCGNYHLTKKKSKARNRAF